MPAALQNALAPLRRTLTRLTTAQKVAAAGALVVLLVGGFFFVRWIAAPSYAPLYTGISEEDAAAVVDQLAANGTPYQLTGGGTTIMVPEDAVYASRLAMSSEGLPSKESDGYSLLDQQDLSTSQFQEQTGYKRAMEGELAKTIGALDGVDTAVVHLAMPQSELFVDEEQPTTASVLVKTTAGDTLSSEQVRAIVYLVSSSVEGLAPEDVSIADSTGRVLSSPGDEAGGGGAGDRQEIVQAYEERMAQAVQAMVDRVTGPGNAKAQVTADLDFDTTRTDTTRYFANPEQLTLSETTAEEEYTGTPGGANGGVVGPDGQLEVAAGEDGADGSSYRKTQRTADNAIGTTTERREAAPGNVTQLHVGVVLDSAKTRDVSPEALQEMLTSAVGIDADRGDTVQVSALPFDRTAEEAAAKDLAAAEAAEARSQYLEWGRNAAIVLAAIVALFLWSRRRKKHHADRMAASSMVVEQLHQQQALEVERQRAIQAADRTAALPIGSMPVDGSGGATRDEIAALVERQPEEIANLLRNWLVDTRR